MAILASATMTSCITTPIDIDFVSVVPADRFHIYDSIHHSYRVKYIIEAFCTSGEIKAKPSYSDFEMRVYLSDSIENNNPYSRRSIKIDSEYSEDWIKITRWGKYFFFDFPKIESYPVPKKKLEILVGHLDADVDVEIIRHFDVLPSSDNQITDGNDNLQLTDSISYE